ncbi:dihydroorotase [Rhodoligotrophos appendicifer]|uniref:dihydroorotase n=1 Tax=Rhodoligotrophos appendicifer TaxID=987056 RepID=UPI001186D425|nr:dihydroorotase [Rhodoligotrophos appendicifer]
MILPAGQTVENGARAYINAQIVDPSTGYEGRGGLITENGDVTACGPDVTADSVGDLRRVDCRGLTLVPGLVDMRVFTGEPGSEHRETLASASEAAAAGGVTTIIVMPNTEPVIDDVALVDFILRRARDTAIVRVAPMAALTKGLNGQQMTEIGMLQEAGAVAVTDGNRPVVNARVLRRALSYARDFDMLVVQHVEEPELAAGGVMNEGEVASRLGLSGIPTAAEVIMLERDLRLVELTGARYHAAQVSCRASLDLMRRAKDNGLPVTCGVSANHLVLNEHDIGAYRTFFKLAPPLRSEEDRAALVAGVADGTIDVIVSGHDPQEPDTKRLPFAESEFGAVGLETLLPCLMGLVHAGAVPFIRLIEALSTGPSAILGMGVGGLRPGAPADFTLIDPERSWRVEASGLRSKSKNSPFEHRVLEGCVMETVVAGHSVYSRDSGAGTAL